MGIGDGLEEWKWDLGGMAGTRSGAEPVRGGGAAKEAESPFAEPAKRGNEVAQAAAASRMEKVAAIQAALAAGTYNVSAAAVASRIVDAMLAGGG